MHIPDNYLSPETCAVMGTVMIPVLVVSVRNVKNKFSRKRLSLIGVSAALSFLMMMFNVPVPGGTTAHAVGGTLLAILLGPEAACLAISSALLIQCLIFGDGGILSYGANIFNMAFVMPFAGWLLYTGFIKLFRFRQGRIAAAAVASYIAINCSALCAGIELGIQPLLFTNAHGVPLYAPYPLSISIPAMLIAHLTMAGVAEVVFTAGILSFIMRVSPDLLNQDAPLRSRKLSLLLLIFIPLTPLGLLASASAWGEWDPSELSKKIGYTPIGMTHGFSYHALISNYALSGLPDIVSYILSAIIGVSIIVIFYRLLAGERENNSVDTGGGKAAQ